MLWIPKGKDSADTFLKSSYDSDGKLRTLWAPDSSNVGEGNATGRQGKLKLETN